MGVLYIIIPLDARCADWLSSEGVACPVTSAASRYPTPREITDVLRQLPGFRCEIESDMQTGEWLAHIESVEPSNPAWTSLRISHYRADDEPHEFYFRKGWPEVIFAVVERLARICGPLVVVEDTGESPVVVGES